MSETLNLPSSTERESYLEPAEQRKQEQQLMRARLTEAFQTADLSKLEKVDLDLEAKLEEFSSELERVTAALRENPLSVESMVTAVTCKEQIALVLWIQAELRGAMKQRQNEAKSGEAGSPFGPN